MQKMEAIQEVQRSSIPVEPVPANVVRETSQGAKTTNVSRSRRNFAETLFDILNIESNNEIMKWVAGGTAFIIVDRKRFTSETLPLYFRGTQYKSFIRKLNRWKFRRITHGPNVGAYQHVLFNRANRSLCGYMSCCTTPTVRNNTSAIDNEPKEPKTTPTHDPMDPLPLLSLRNSSTPTCAPGSTRTSFTNDALKAHTMLEQERTILKRHTLLIEMQMELASLGAHNTTKSPPSPPLPPSSFPTQNLYPFSSRKSFHHDARQTKIKSILKSRASPLYQRDLLLRQIEGLNAKIRIEKRMRLVIMKAKEMKLLTDIKYLLAMAYQARLRQLPQEVREV